MGEHRTVIDDDYTGDLSGGSAPQRRTLGNATIIKISVGPMDNNSYLVTDSASGETLLVDAANDADRLNRLVDEHAPKLQLVVTTHQHPDHWQALADVIEHTGAPSASHVLDADPLPVSPSRLLADGDTVTVGSLSLDVVHLAGHTPGGVALALTDPSDGRVHVFTGDSLFPGGVGKTADEAAFTSLLGDVTAKLFDAYDDRTAVYPGHGKDTTLGAERPHLAEWRERGW